MSYFPSQEIRFVKGVGPRRAKDFESAGITTVEDALYYLPLRYEDRTNLKPISSLRKGDEAAIRGRVKSSHLRRTRKKGFTIYEILLDDETGSLKVIWMNRPYLDGIMKKGRELIVFGEAAVGKYGDSLEMRNPEYEPVDTEDDPLHTGNIVPVYSKVGGIGRKHLRKIMYEIVSNLDPGIPEFLPEETVKRLGLAGRAESFGEAHFPRRLTDEKVLNDSRSPAHRRLIFEEFFILQTGIQVKRGAFDRELKGIRFRTSPEMGDKLRDILPFSLTGAQRKVFREITADMTSSRPMNRLIQGDVGSGKTIVALLSMLLAVENGYQAALMAPTEILAEQHYKNICELLKGKDYGIVLLKAGQRKSERENITGRIETGDARIVIGTHALIQENIKFDGLGLAVIDEQHRFGVMQRASVIEKGYNPDVLVMTATPIPRTLALTVYGDLDFSVIDQLPPGRKPVETKVFSEKKRFRLYGSMKGLLAEGGQAYLVYPLIEESEKSDMKAAVDMVEKLKDQFPSFSVGLIHGKMKGEEKDRVMKDFKRGDTHILVATTVIEVGIDVPNANLLVVENAERFGLAQLHQLRGRIGRGRRKSYCILMTDGKISKTARERLKIMEKTNDGFKIAETDLALRGPGEFFGTRQSGIPGLKVGNIIRDVEMMETARKEARRLLEKSGSGGKTKRTINKIIKEWKRRFDLVTVG